MARSDVLEGLSRVDQLLEEFDLRLPAESPRNADFRADLAGLLVVLIAATYENCVKDILVRFAESKHVDFGGYASRSYEKINSRIRIGDLKKYARNFDPDIENVFVRSISKKKSDIFARTGIDIVKCYDQLLDWRHAFAHQGARIVSLEEAARFHRYARRVMIAFDKSFGC